MITSESDENRALIRMWFAMRLPFESIYGDNLRQGLVWEPFDYSYDRVLLDNWFEADKQDDYDYFYRLTPLP